MSLTCIIIAGSLWVSTGNLVFQVESVIKEPNADHVFIYADPALSRKTFDISEQHQVRMNAEEWVADCIGMGYEIPSYGDGSVPWDDIDRGEEEYFGEE